MILTKDRRDCVGMNLLLHERGGSFEVFDRVVFLLNGVTRRHMRFIDEWIERHPRLQCDKILGDGTRPQGIAAMQNRCIQKYPGCFYAKTDEDIFVPSGWARMMWDAYLAHRDRDDLALITPLIPNNGYGLFILLTQFYTELLEEHRRRFGCDPSPEAQGLTWRSPLVGEWATRAFLNLREANSRHRGRVGSQPFLYFSRHFSIGCIAYDYRHWQRMGGIPPTDETGWCAWIAEHHHVNVLDCRQIALHYTFFVQQEWLDRTQLLEDIRAANLPDTLTWAHRMQLTRAVRIAKQIPNIIRRRWSAVRARGRQTIS
ncbi:MAG: hypothetical protein NZ740_10590 [Kiritimatiellae bacterium]|nr:hypothetical protein [Kiritimatiellia bacterium]MDW8459533.1 hypothetical protein [Verrucomicrobiota bacterium]